MNKLVSTDSFLHDILKHTSIDNVKNIGLLSSGVNNFIKKNHKHILETEFNIKSKIKSIENVPLIFTNNDNYKDYIPTIELIILFNDDINMIKKRGYRFIPTKYKDIYYLCRLIDTKIEFICIFKKEYNKNGFYDIPFSKYVNNDEPKGIWTINTYQKNISILEKHKISVFNIKHNCCDIQYSTYQGNTDDNILCEHMILHIIKKKDI